MKVGFNIEVEAGLDQLTAVFDLGRGGRISKSGKTRTLATTGRPQPIELSGGEVVYLVATVYRYPRKG